MISSFRSVLQVELSVRSSGRTFHLKYGSSLVQKQHNGFDSKGISDSRRASISVSKRLGGAAENCADQLLPDGFLAQKRF
jgi:hypothetical protein